MQYLQNLQKLMVKDLGFGYTLGETIPATDPSPLFTLHRSTKKEDGTPALVLAHVPAKAGGGAVAPPRGPARSDLARAALRQLRTVRHPDVLRYVDSADAPDGTLYVATEAAVPLSSLLASDTPPPPPALQWGLFTLSRALGFLHASGKLHARLSPATVFVTAGGDWRLGGFDAACAATSAATALPSVGVADLQFARYMAPEMARGDWAGIAAGPPSAIDSWAFGCLMYEVHSRAFTSAEQLRNVACIPKGLLPAYQKLLASNPVARAPAGEVVNLPALARSPFVAMNLFVEDLALKGAVEREAFLAKIPSATGSLPDGFCIHKLLPLLDATVMAAAAAGGAAAAVGAAPGGSVVSAAAVAVVLHLHGRLPADTFATDVLSPYVVRWVAAPTADRALRTQLLAQLGTFAPALSDADINGGVFSGLVAAFGDASSPALRDAAVKSSLSIAPRLTDKHLNVTLMGHFARLQLDTEPAIRTNTTVCIGKLAPKLTPTARGKVLLPAFLRALKDPFPPARAAALSALLAAVPLYSTPDAAVRVLPAASPCLVDAAADVRAAAFALLAALTPRLEAHAAEMGRAAEAAAAAAAASSKGGPLGGGGGGAGSSGGLGAAGWGMSSLTSLTSALLKTGAGGPGVANGGGGRSGGMGGGAGGGMDPAAAAAAAQRAGAGVGFGSDSWSSAAAAPAPSAAGAGNGPSSSSTSVLSAGRPAAAAGGRPPFGGSPFAAAAAGAPDEAADDAGSDWGDLDDTFGDGGGDEEEEAAAAAAAAAAATGSGVRRSGSSTSSVDAFFGAAPAVPAAPPRRPPGGGGLGGGRGVGAARAGVAPTASAAPPRRPPGGGFGRPPMGVGAATAAAAAPPPTTSASGRPLGRLASAAASKKSAADDWEALLGSSSPAKPRKR